MTQQPFFRRFLAADEGGILLLWAVLMPVIVGMMGLGLETGLWYMEKRKLQTAADAAAIAAAYESSSSNRTTAAQSSVTANGFGTGSGVTVTVNNPPSNGAYTSNNNAVEVILSQQQTTLFSSLYLAQKPTVTARAVGLKTVTNTGTACILSLDSTGSSDISSNGGASINAPNCIVASNSSNSSALTMNGGANMKVQSLYLMGNYKLTVVRRCTRQTLPSSMQAPLLLILMRVLTLRRLAHAITIASALTEVQ